MVIDSRLIHNFKTNIYFLIRYKFEIVIINFCILLLFFLFGNPDFFSVSLFGFWIILLNLFVFYKITKLRMADIDKIEAAIRAIGYEDNKKLEQVKFGKDLKGIEQAITELFEKSKTDLAQMQKLEQMRSQFLANVSHELRTPIFAIQGFLETLEEGAVDDKKVNRVFLAKASKRVQNLSDLLNDLIDISMIETGEMIISNEEFKVYEMIDGIVADFQENAREKNIELILHPFSVDTLVIGDQKRIRQVIVNLVQNAIKYTEKGMVEISVKTRDDFCEIAINDTGIGIAELDIDRIFERFYRVDKNRSRTMGGTGLGLAIVKHILEAQGSEINVQSSLGRGSKFSFRLKNKISRNSAT